MDRGPTDLLEELDLYERFHAAFDAALSAQFEFHGRLHAFLERLERSGGWRAFPPGDPDGARLFRAARTGLLKTLLEARERAAGAGDGPLREPLDNAVGLALEAVAVLARGGPREASPEAQRLLRSAADSLEVAHGLAADVRSKDYVRFLQGLCEGLTPGEEQRSDQHLEPFARLYRSKRDRCRRLLAALAEDGPAADDLADALARLRPMHARAPRAVVDDLEQRADRAAWVARVLDPA